MTENPADIRVLSWVGLGPYDDTAETLYRRSKP